MRILLAATLVCLPLTSVTLSAQEPGPDPYRVVDWMEPFAQEGFAWGSHPGVFIESDDRIFVVQRGEIELPDPVPPEFEGFVGSIGVRAEKLRSY